MLPALSLLKSKKVSSVHRHGNISLTMATEGTGLYSLTWRNMMTGVSTSVTKLGGTKFVVGRQVADLDIPLTEHPLDTAKQAFRYFFVNIDVLGNSDDHIRESCEDATRFIRRMEPGMESIKIDKRDITMRRRLGRTVLVGHSIEQTRQARLLDILAHKHRVLVQIKEGDSYSLLELPADQVWIDDH